MTILYYPPTWEGFLTAVFEAFGRSRRGESISIRHPRGRDATSLFSAEQTEPDPVKAGRVERGMGRLAPDLAETVYMAWLSELESADDDLLAFLHLAFDRNTDPRPDLSHPAVKAVNGAVRKTALERMRMMQFVRFVQAPEGFYVSDIEPDCNVLALIGEHFHRRFNDQNFLIRDLRRRLILVSGGENWFIRELTTHEKLLALPSDGAFEELWRGYFKAISNPARKNLKLQQKFVPLKYREHLTEFKL
jgi:probable DNA metabolism protein